MPKQPLNLATLGYAYLYLYLCYVGKANKINKINPNFVPRFDGLVSNRGLEATTIY